MLARRVTAIDLLSNGRAQLGLGEGRNGCCRRGHEKPQCDRIRISTSAQGRLDNHPGRVSREVLPTAVAPCDGVDARAGVGTRTYVQSFINVRGCEASPPARKKRSYSARS